MSSTKDAQRVFGVPGAALVLVGAVLALVAFRFLNWYRTPAHADSAPRITFGQLHSSADQLSGSATAAAYFDWVGWLLIIAMVALGIAASLPTAAADVLRLAGFVAGTVGVAMTYLAVAQLHKAQVAAGGTRHNAFHNSTWGLWLAVTGFALGAVGAGLGPRKART